MPPPPGKSDELLKGLIYNSHFDSFKGVVLYVCVMDGVLRKGQNIRLMRGGTEHQVTDIS